MSDSGEGNGAKHRQPNRAAMQASIEKRLEFVAKTAEKMMHLEGGASGVAAKDDTGKGRRRRMEEKAEDDILMKRAETEALAKINPTDPLILA